jgi:hypothetical protein
LAGCGFHAARVPILTRLWANTPCAQQVRAPLMPVIWTTTSVLSIYEGNRARTDVKLWAARSGARPNQAAPRSGLPSGVVAISFSIANSEAMVLA